MLPLPSANISDVHATVPENSGDVVDMAVLAGYEEIQLDDEPDLVVELIDLYRADAPRRLGVMQGLLAQGNWQLMKREAHSLRGSSGNLGAIQVAQICSELEGMEFDDPRANVAVLLDRLEKSLNPAFEAFLAERRRRSK